MIGVTWLIVMINWTYNSHFLASDWSVQNNELMTLINCHKKGHLTSLIGCWVAWRVTGRAASFGILLAMIIDGSVRCLMSDDDENSNISWHQWAGNICPVYFLIGRAESVLSWSAGWQFRSVRWWSNDFDGGSVMLTKIDGYHASKIIF